MRKLKITIVITLAATLCLAGATYAAPASPKIWPASTTSDANKEWSVKFNMAIDPATVNADTVYVQDEYGTLHSVSISLSSDQTVIKIKPNAPYTSGPHYELYITDGVISASGKRLARPVVIPFTVSNTSSGKQAIVSVSDAYSPLVTEITVTASPNVYMVTANGTEMHYEGNNTYTLGITKLNIGGTVTIRAYDMNGKLLETLKHTVR